MESNFLEELRKDFLEDVRKECNTHRCHRCRYYDDSEEECLFSEDPFEWDFPMIITAYNAGKEEAIK